MFAIIQAGGRQVRVEPGTVVTVDNRAGGPGDEVTFDQVLFLSGDEDSKKAGAPLVAGARVTGVVDGPQAGPKIRSLRRSARARTSVPGSPMGEMMKHSGSASMYRRWKDFDPKGSSDLYSSLSVGLNLVKSLCVMSRSPT